jgi:hypothetical protein
MTGLTARSIALVDGETTSTTARTASQGKPGGHLTDCSGGHDHDAGDQELPARQGYVNRFEHLASAPTVMGAWVRVRCGHSIEITGMFNAHHARAVLAVSGNRSVRLSANCQCPERRSDDGQTILECAPTGPQIMP